MSQPATEHELEPEGFLFVCRNMRGQYKHGGNVAVCWSENEETPAEVDCTERRDDERPGHDR
jgi:hypothetical protein